jgi:hypothetical protein
MSDVQKFAADRPPPSGPVAMLDLRSALGLFYFLFELLALQAARLVRIFRTRCLACFAAVGDDFRTLVRDSPQYPFAFGRRGLVSPAIVPRLA